MLELIGLNLKASPKFREASSYTTRVFFLPLLTASLAWSYSEVGVNGGDSICPCPEYAIPVFICSLNSTISLEFWLMFLKVNPYGAVWAKMLSLSAISGISSSWPSSCSRIELGRSEYIICLSNYWLTLIFNKFACEIVSCLDGWLNYVSIFFWSIIWIMFSIPLLECGEIIVWLRLNSSICLIILSLDNEELSCPTFVGTYRASVITVPLSWLIWLWDFFLRILLRLFWLELIAWFAKLLLGRFMGSPELDL